MNLETRKEILRLHTQLQRSNERRGSVPRTHPRSLTQTTYGIVRGKVSANCASTDPVFSITQIATLLEDGVDPRQNPSDATERLPVANAFGQSYQAGEDLFAVYSEQFAQPDDWEAGVNIKEGSIRRATPMDEKPRIYQANTDHTSSSLFDDDLSKWDRIRWNETINWIPLVATTGGDELRLIRGYTPSDYDTTTAPDTFYFLESPIALTEGSRLPDGTPVVIEAVFPITVETGDKIIAVYNPDNDETASKTPWEADTDIDNGDKVWAIDPDTGAPHLYTWTGPAGNTGGTFNPLDPNWTDEGRLQTGWENLPSGSGGGPTTVRIELKSNKQYTKTVDIDTWMLDHSNQRLIELPVTDPLSMFTGAGASDDTFPGNPSSGRGHFGYATQLASADPEETLQWVLTALDTYPYLVIATANNNESHGVYTSGEVQTALLLDNRTESIPDNEITIVDEHDILETGLRSDPRHTYLCVLKDATTAPPEYQVVTRASQYIGVRGTVVAHINATPVSVAITGFWGDTGTAPVGVLGGVALNCHQLGPTVPYGAGESVAAFYNPVLDRFELIPRKPIQCGLKYDTDQAYGALVVNTEDLIGRGLRESFSENDCQIEVAIGCGIKYLQDEARSIAINVGCGLKCVDPPSQDILDETGKLEFDAQFIADHSRESLEKYDDCGLKVKPNCVIKSFDHCELKIEEGFLRLKMYWREYKIYGETESGEQIVECESIPLTETQCEIEVVEC